MDGTRVDRWARIVSHAMSRRELTRATLGGMLATGLLGSVSTGGVRAQGGTPAATPCPPTTTEESTDIGLQYFDAFNTGDADALGALLAEDYRHQGALVAEQDRALHQERLRIIHTAFPDGYYDVQAVIADGDLVAVRWVFAGTLQAEYAGVEPSGQEVAIRGVHIHRIACNQIVETWNSGDALGLLRQIGALPSPDAGARTPIEEIATPTPATPPADCPDTSAEENAEIGRRWTEEALDQHALDILDEFVSPNIVHHAGVFVDEHGIDQLKSDLQALLDGFPDIRFTADVIVAAGDQVAVRWTGRGTHDGEFLGLAPTGRPVVFSGINIYRVACGMIVEGWSEPDSLDLLRQLGAVPEEGTPTSD